MNCNDITIVNKLGLHARASAKFVEMASRFNSTVTISRNGQTVNGKSIMGLMMLAAAKGSEVTICSDGSDEQTATDGLCALINDYFGEDE
ncbi:MAG: HPr family phosphocarrier protein [Proteobacteria bacterium]|nr:HPr family phosphocarrier protein [Pseudomonadota bacterium]